MSGDSMFYRPTLSDLLRIRLRGVLVAVARLLEALAGHVRAFAEDHVWPGW